MNKPDSTINVFIVNSSFQLVSALLLSQNKNHLIFCYKSCLFEAAKRISPNASHILLDKSKKTSKLLQKIITIKNISTVFRKIKKTEATKINFFFTSLSGSRYNYFVAASKEKLSNKIINFNIIPDGTLNIITHRLSDNKKHRIQKRRNSILDKMFGLEYSTFKEDKYGILSDHISKIYVIPGTNTELPEHKRVELPPFKKNQTKRGDKRALVIGQPLSNHRIIDKSSSSLISEKLSKFIHDNEIKNTTFAPHPSESNKTKPFEFHNEKYEIFDKNIPLELEMIENSYDYVIGFTSTALISAKLIYGDSSEIFFLGEQYFNYDKHPIINNIIDVFKSMGIKKI